MSTYYVWSGATGANNGTSWANAYTSFGSAVAAANLNTDEILINYSHQEALGADTTYTFLANINVYTVNKDNSNTLIDMLYGGGYIGNTTTNRSITLAGAKNVYIYGITFRTAGSTADSIILGTTDGCHYEFENCWFYNGNTASTSVIQLGSTTNAYLKFTSCGFTFGSTAQSISIRSARIDFEGCLAPFSGATPSTLFTSGAAAAKPDVRFVGCDFSPKAAGNIVASQSSQAGVFQFSQCKFGASISPLATQTPSNKGSGIIYLLDCTLGTTKNFFGYYDAFGSCVIDSGIYYTSGAANKSWKIVTTAHCSYYTPFISPFVDVYNTNTSSITPYFETLYYSYSYNSLTYGNGLYVAITNTGNIITSTNGNNWIRQVSGISGIALNGIIYGNNLYVTVGNSGTILTSSDGITWTARTSGTTQNLRSITYGNNLFIAVGESGIILTSSDAVSWTSRTSGTAETLIGVAYGSAQYVAVSAASNLIISSSDGITWTTRNTGSGFFSGITYGNGWFVTTDYANTGYVARSSDGITWNIGNLIPSSSRLSGSTSKKIRFVNGLFIMIGSDSGFGAAIITSLDNGLNWSSIVPVGPYFSVISDIVYNDSKYTVVLLLSTDSSTILESTNLSLWTNQPTPPLQNDQVWAEFFVKTTDSSTASTLYSDRTTLLTKPINHSFGSNTGLWTGSGSYRSTSKIDTGNNVIPVEAGHIRGRIVVGQPNLTVYVDPQIRT